MEGVGEVPPAGVGVYRSARARAEAGMEGTGSAGSMHAREQPSGDDEAWGCSTSAGRENPLP